MKWVARNYWRLWNISNHCSLNSSFELWGRVNVGRKMWWQNNDLQHAWKNYANLHQMTMSAFQSLNACVKIMCDIFTKCTECCKIIEHPRNKKNKGGKTHQCGVTQCPVCQEDVDIRTHKFFIQPAEEVSRRWTPTYYSMLRDQSGEPYTCISRRTLFSGLYRISRSIGYQWRRIRKTCHCHVSQPDRLWRYVYPTRTVQSTSSGGKSSLCWHQKRLPSSSQEPEVPH